MSATSLKTPINNRLDKNLKLRYNMGQAAWEIYSLDRGTYGWFRINMEQAIFYRDMGVPNATAKMDMVPDSHNIFL